MRIKKEMLIIGSFFLSLTLYATQEYVGKVVPIDVEQLCITTNAYDCGWVDYTARLGQIVKSDIYNSEGKVIIPGDILIYGNATAWELYLQAAKTQVLENRTIKDIAYDTYKRYKNIAEKAAVSQLTFTDVLSKLAAADGQYLSSIELLKQGEIGANQLLIRTPFEGIVTAITQASGSDVGLAPAIEITELNPIGIKIEMPMKRQKEITSSANTIKVYVKGMNEPFELHKTDSILTSNGVVFVISNYPVLEKNIILKDTRIPVLREWQPVVNFDFISLSSKTLAVPVEAIQNDDKGSYVWRAKGQKVMRLDKGIDYTFPIEKVYVVAGEMIRYYTSYTKVISLKERGTLERYDLVLNRPPPGLKEAERVIYPQQAYLFMPGDEVKVVVENALIEDKPKSSGVKKALPKETKTCAKISKYL